MKRILPSPLLSLVLLATWLLLNQSLEAAHLLLGTLLAVIAPLLARPLQPHGYARIHRPLALFKLLGKASVEVLADINTAVMRGLRGEGGGT